jgi:hypothetical protein
MFGPECAANCSCNTAHGSCDNVDPPKKRLRSLTQQGLKPSKFWGVAAVLDHSRTSLSSDLFQLSTVRGGDGMCVPGSCSANSVGGFWANSNCSDCDESHIGAACTANCSCSTAHGGDSGCWHGTVGNGTCVGCYGTPDENGAWCNATGCVNGWDGPNCAMFGKMPGFETFGCRGGLVLSVSESTSNGLPLKQQCAAAVAAFNGTFLYAAGANTSTQAHGTEDRFVCKTNGFVLTYNASIGMLQVWDARSTVVLQTSDSSRIDWECLPSTFNLNATAVVIGLKSGSCQCQGNTGGPNCTACEPGYFGPACAGLCTCDKTRGTCNEGRAGDGHCVAGSCKLHFAGQDCKECVATMFGPECAANCSCNTAHGSCNNTAPDRETRGGSGHCVAGTCGSSNSTGFWNGNDDCSECDSTHTGIRCRTNCTCSSHGKYGCWSGIAGNGSCVGCYASPDSHGAWCAAGACDLGWTGTDCDVFGKMAGTEAFGCRGGFELSVGVLTSDRTPITAACKAAVATVNGTYTYAPASTVAGSSWIQKQQRFVSSAGNAVVYDMATKSIQLLDPTNSFLLTSADSSAVDWTCGQRVSFLTSHQTTTLSRFVDLHSVRCGLSCYDSARLTLHSAVHPKVRFDSMWSRTRTLQLYVR